MAVDASILLRDIKGSSTLSIFITTWPKDLPADNGRHLGIQDHEPKAHETYRHDGRHPSDPWALQLLPDPRRGESEADVGEHKRPPRHAVSQLPVEGRGEDGQQAEGEEPECDAPDPDGDPEREDLQDLRGHGICLEVSIAFWDRPSHADEGHGSEARRSNGDEHSRPHRWHWQTVLHQPAEVQGVDKRGHGPAEALVRDPSHQHGYPILWALRRHDCRGQCARQHGRKDGQYPTRRHGVDGQVGALEEDKELDNRRESRESRVQPEAHPQSSGQPGTDLGDAVGCRVGQDGGHAEERAREEEALGRVQQAIPECPLRRREANDEADDDANEHDDGEDEEHLANDLQPVKLIRRAVQHQRDPPRAHDKREPGPGHVLDALEHEDSREGFGRPEALVGGPRVALLPFVLLHVLSMLGSRRPQAEGFALGRAGERHHDD